MHLSLANKYLTFNTCAWAQHFAVLTSDVLSLSSWRLLAALEVCGSQSIGSANCSGPVHSPRQKRGCLNSHPRDVRHGFARRLNQIPDDTGLSAVIMVSTQCQELYRLSPAHKTNLPLRSSGGGEDLVIERTLVLICSYFPNMGKFSMSMRLGYDYF